MLQLNTLLQKSPKLEEALGIFEEILTPQELTEAQTILSPEEIKTSVLIALREALTTKRAQIKTEEYNRKIKNPAQKPKVSQDQFFLWIENKAKNEVKNFKLTPQEVEIYKILCLYFTEDKKFEELGYSLDKGLWLYGNVGCGKTTIMKLFRENPMKNYGVVECMAIADDYKDKEIGVEVISTFSKAQTACFNDLGTEIESGVSSNFGNKKNVMAEIILNHYEKNIEKKFRFHFTTNLGAEEVERLYGPRVRSRLREMCNIISLDGINDKRV